MLAAPPSIRRSPAMSTIFSLYRAAMKEFFRDRMATFWTLAFPILFIILFGAIFSGGGSPTYSVGLVNQDNGPVSIALAGTFKSIKALSVKSGDLSTQMDNLKKGQLDMVVVLPAGMSQAVQSGASAQVQMYFDPSKNPTNAQIEQNIVQQIVDGFNKAATQQHTALTLQTN